MSRRNVDGVLARSMTVGELIRYLKGFSEDAAVLFANDYGDRGSTMQALAVNEPECVEASQLVDSAYSGSGVALEDDVLCVPSRGSACLVVVEQGVECEEVDGGEDEG